MGIGRRIKEARNNLGITQEELSRLLGVTKGAVANYENETSHPKEPILYKLIEILKVDANYLFQDAVNLPKNSNDVSLSEYEHIKKYRVLDIYDKNMVDMMMEIIYKRYADAFEEDGTVIVKTAAYNGNGVQITKRTKAHEAILGVELQKLLNKLNTQEKR